jgi:hemoglobin
MTRGVHQIVVVVGLFVTALAGCATMTGKTEPTLYERLGGRHAIRLVVDDFVTNVAADSRVNARFKDMKPADVERFKSNLADQICQAAGGPCSYLGRDMKTVHTGMKVTDAEWNATIEDLVKALDKHKVAEKEKKELLALVEPMRPQIVGQ